MTIGIPKETKIQEYRVAITPNGAGDLIKSGHKVLIESGAGKGSGFPDNDYKKMGAKIKKNRTEIWKQQLIIKVKEPLKSEYRFLREKQTIFTFLHLASAPKLTNILQKKKITAIDYSTVETAQKELSLLKPMSEIAGKLAPQVGARFLEKQSALQTLGILLSGIKGVSPANVLIIGGGIVGFNAAKIALGMGAKVKILEKSRERRQLLKKNLAGTFKNRFSCLPPSAKELEESIKNADLLIGAVLVAGAKTPKIIRKKMVQIMKKGSVIVDVSMDQGGCVETSSPTTHKNPVFAKYGVIHYCVTNMPGIVPKTSTLALTKSTLPYILELADSNLNIKKIIKKNPALAKGINVFNGKITHKKLAESLNREYHPIEKLI